MQPLKADGKLKQANKQLAAFVDLKYNLLLSYATYLTFYLLLRVEGASNDLVRDHPVLFKITTVKKTLDGLRGLDSKLESVLRRKLQGKNLSLLGKRPEPEDEKDEASEQQSEAPSQSEAEGSYDDEEEDLEEDMDDNVVDTDALLTRTEQRSLQTAQVEALQSRISKLKKDDLRSIVKSSNAPKKPKVSHPEEEAEAKERAAKDQARKDRAEVERQREKDIEEGRARKRKEKEASKAAKEEVKAAHMEAIEGERQTKEKDIVRNINYVIMKSKGLTRKRKKIDRNSRVKHREKYKKALQKRKSKVQEFKEGPQGKYGGESSGFKTGLIRSTKLS